MILGLENDLNTSDDFLFPADRLLTGCSSASLGLSICISLAIIAIGADLFGLALDEDSSIGLTAFSCLSLKALVLLWVLSSIFSAENFGISILGRLLVLRYTFPLSGLEGLNSARMSYFDTCVLNDSKLCLEY